MDSFFITLHRGETVCTCKSLEGCPAQIDTLIYDESELSGLLKLYPHMRIIRDSRLPGFGFIRCENISLDELRKRFP